MKPRKQVNRLLKLAEIIEEQEDHFDMASWVHTEEHGDFHSFLSLFALVEAETVGEFANSLKKGNMPMSCGTTACLGGWTVLTWPDEVDPNETIEYAAQRILGFDDSTIGGLFSSDADHQSAAEAAAELRRRAAAIIEEMVDA